MSDDPTRSPALLGPLPKRGPGVRRLNRVPVWIAAGGVCGVIAAVGYTYKARLDASVAQQREQESSRGEGAIPAVLNGAPKGNDVRLTANRMPNPFKGGTQDDAQASSQRVQSDQQSAAHQPPEDAAEQARKQAWQTYYQQLAALQQQRQQEALSAMKADTAPNGPGGQQQAPSATPGPDQQATEAQGVAPPSRAQVASTQFGMAPQLGGLGIGGGYPILPPAGPDPAGAREKQAFTGQTGNLGQNDTLAATVRDPISPYLVTAGDVIPCVAQGGEDSDTPGQFVGRVSRNVYDSATGRFLLIPQNSKVIGSYDNIVTTGQSRIPTVITRIIFPDSSSIPLGAMPAADQGGFAGLHDQVDRHLWEKFGNAAILAIGSAGIQISQGNGQSAGGYNSQQIGAAAIGQQFGELGQEFARSGLSIPNTLRVRPGYSFVVQVTKDMVLRPYVDRRTAGAAVQPVRLGPVMQ